MSEIEFVSSAKQGDLVELAVERIVFVGLGPEGEPLAHGYSDITYNRDRISVA